MTSSWNASYLRKLVWLRLSWSADSHQGPIWAKHITCMISEINPGSLRRFYVGGDIFSKSHDVSLSRVSLSLQWRHNGRDIVSNHQPHDCLLNRLFRRRSKKTSKLRVTGLCAANSPGTGEFPAQMASNAENVSIWWRHHVKNIVRHTAHTIVSWPNPKQWLMIHTSGLMMIIR